MDHLIPKWHLVQKTNLAGCVFSPISCLVRSTMSPFLTKLNLNFRHDFTHFFTYPFPRSFQIYDVLTGDQLAVIYLPVAIESISMDPMGYFLFPGGSNGIIYETKLYEESGSDIFSRKSKDGNPTFVGHKLVFSFSFLSSLFLYI